MEKVSILGFGREGKSLLKFLKKHPKYRGAKIEILDQVRNKNYLKNLKSFDLVFRSPGVPYNLPEIQKAIKARVKFSSATKLFFDLCPAPIIGITGTKGKGTTSTLLYQILKKCGRKVFLAGNIGKPALDILNKVNKKDLVILELSSFQLQDLQKSPHVAVVTDVFPDHLDAHKNMKEYVDAKTNIARHQKKSDIIFYFQDNPLSSQIAKKSPGTKIGITGEPFGLKKNYVLAATVAAYLNCPTEKIFHTIKNFKGVEHRLELVREIGGVRFYNDSASTNPQTAAAAISSLSSPHFPLVLIAGGKDKNLDYKPLAEAIKTSGNVKKIILIGENKEKIRASLERIKNKELRIKNTADLESAVKLAYNFARKFIIRNSCFVILFSPGSASFDMFKDYADRGEKFKEIVRRL
jgi:UDP-N-acetylmuramoylalanine--D-glutamate ligase